MASGKVSGGKIVASRLASMVFPEPGGPIIRILCPPAAAMTMARFTCSWPLTSAKSISSPVLVSSSTAGGGSGVRSAAPRRNSTTSGRLCAAYTARSGTTAASRAFSLGMIKSLQPGLAAGQRHGQHPPGGFQPPVQGYLAIEQILIQIFLGRQTLGRQEPQGDGQVKTGAVFPDIGGSQIDGDPGPGKMITGIFNRRFDPVLALFNRNFRQPHGGEGRHAKGNIHFNFHQETVHSPDGPTGNPG